jgi:hypothetical protein
VNIGAPEPASALTRSPTSTLRRHCAIERRHDVLELGERSQPIYRRLLRPNVRLGDFDAGLRGVEARLLRLYGRLLGLLVLNRLESPLRQIVRALQICRLQREVRFGRRDLRFRLAQSGVDSAELGHGLGELLIEIGRGDMNEQVALLDARSDIDPALRNIAGRASIEVGDPKRFRLAGQKRFDRLILTLGNDGSHCRKVDARSAAG